MSQDPDRYEWTNFRDLVQGETYSALKSFIDYDIDTRKEIEEFINILTGSITSTKQPILLMTTFTQTHHLGKCANNNKGQLYGNIRKCIIKLVNLKAEELGSDLRLLDDILLNFNDNTRILTNNEYDVEYDVLWKNGEASEIEALARNQNKTLDQFFTTRPDLKIKFEDLFSIGPRARAAEAAEKAAAAQQPQPAVQPTAAATANQLTAAEIQEGQDLAHAIRESLDQLKKEEKEREEQEIAYLQILEESRHQAQRDDEMRFEMARQHDFRQDRVLEFSQIKRLINGLPLLRELKILIEVQTRIENEKLVLDSHLERLGLDPDNVETNYDAQPNLRQAHANFRILGEVIHSILPTQIARLKGYVTVLKDAVQKVAKVAQELRTLEKIKKPLISANDDAKYKRLIEKEKKELIKKLDADTQKIDTSRDKAIEAVKNNPGNLTKVQSIMKDALDFLSSIPARMIDIKNHEANLLNAFKTDPKIGDRLVKLFNDKLKLQEQKKYLEEAIDKDIEAVFNDASREAQNSVLAHPEDLSLVGRSLTVLERFFATLPARQKDIEEINRKTNELQNNYDESIAQILQFNDDFARQEWQKSEKTKEMATGLKYASKIFSDFLQKNVNITSHKCEELADYFATHTCDNDADLIAAGQYLIDFSA